MSILRDLLTTNGLLLCSCVLVATALGCATNASPSSPADSPHGSRTVAGSPMARYPNGNGAFGLRRSGTLTLLVPQRLTINPRGNCFEVRFVSEGPHGPTVLSVDLGSQ